MGRPLKLAERKSSKLIDNLTRNRSASPSKDAKAVRNDIALSAYSRKRVCGGHKRQNSVEEPTSGVTRQGNAFDQEPLRFEMR